MDGNSRVRVLARFQTAAWLLALLAGLAIGCGDTERPGPAPDSAAEPPGTHLATDPSVQPAPQGESRIDADSLERLLALDQLAADTLEPCRPRRPQGDPPDPAARSTFLQDGDRYDCSLGSGLEFVVTLSVDTLEPDYRYVTGLRVRGPDGVERELRPTVGEPPPTGFAFIGTIDLDFDGWRDLELLVAWGATGNLFYNIWRWDPAAGVFVADSALARLGNPVPLAGTRCLRTRGTGGMAGNIYRMSIDCWERGSLGRIGGAEQDRDSAGFFVRMLRIRQPGSDTLVLVRTDTIREPGGN